MAHIEGADVGGCRQHWHEAVQSIAVLHQSQALCVETDGCQHVRDAGNGLSSMHQPCLQESLTPCSASHLCDLQLEILISKQGGYVGSSRPCLF